MFAVVNDKTDTVSLCGLTWDQVFLMDGLLLSAMAEMKNEFINEHINEIVENIEAAEERIFEDY